MSSNSCTVERKFSWSGPQGSIHHWPWSGQSAGAVQPALPQGMPEGHQGPFPSSCQSLPPSTLREESTWPLQTCSRITDSYFFGGHFAFKHTKSHVHTFILRQRMVMFVLHVAGSGTQHENLTFLSCEHPLQLSHIEVCLEQPVVILNIWIIYQAIELFVTFCHKYSTNIILEVKASDQRVSASSFFFSSSNHELVFTLDSNLMPPFIPI